MDNRYNRESILVSSLGELYLGYGYENCRANRFEDYELYANNRSFLRTDRILTFTDADGRLKAMRPDVTLSIVRNYGGEALQKVRYTENIFRSDENGFRQIPQTGLECLGEVDDVIQSEVLMLACRSLSMISEDYLLDLSHLGFLTGLVSSITAGETGRKLLEAVRQKNASSLRRLCREAGVSPETEQDLLWALQAYETPQVMLERMRQMICCPEMEEAWQELRRVVDGALCFLPEAKIRIDLSILDDLNYYNGLIFRGMVRDIPVPLLYGGRYDNLLTVMGKEGKAIGFAVYLDLLERFEDEERQYDIDVLLLYGEKDSPLSVIGAMKALREQGFAVRAQRFAEGVRAKKVMRMPEADAESAALEPATAPAGRLKEGTDR